MPGVCPSAHDCSGLHSKYYRLINICSLSSSEVFPHDPAGGGPKSKVTTGLTSEAAAVNFCHLELKHGNIHPGMLGPVAVRQDCIIVTEET